MSTNTNNEETVPTLSVPMQYTDGKFDPEKFSQAALDMAIEWVETEEKTNKEVRSAAEKLINDPKTPRHLLASQLARGILNLQGNVFSKDQEVAEMSERVKAIYSNDERFVYNPRGIYAGFHKKAAYKAEELAKISGSKSEE